MARVVHQGALLLGALIGLRQSRRARAAKVDFDLEAEMHNDLLEEMEAALAEADLDKDGALTMDEILADSKKESAPDYAPKSPQELADDAEEKRVLKRWFAVSDANKDGKLDSEELPAYIQQVDAAEVASFEKEEAKWAEPKPGGEVTEALMVADKDKDGVLSLKEILEESRAKSDFKDLHHARVADEEELMVTRGFSLSDANKDMVLDFSEIPSFIRRMEEDDSEAAPREHQEPEGASSLIDAPAEEKDELVHEVGQALEEADRDMDGALTLNEIIEVGEEKAEEASKKGQSAEVKAAQTVEEEKILGTFFEASDEDMDGRLNTKELPSYIQKVDDVAWAGADEKDDAARHDAETRAAYDIQSKEDAKKVIVE